MVFRASDGTPDYPPRGILQLKARNPPVPCGSEEDEECRHVCSGVPETPTKCVRAAPVCEMQCTVAVGLGGLPSERCSVHCALRSASWGGRLGGGAYLGDCPADGEDANLECQLNSPEAPKHCECHVRLDPAASGGPTQRQAVRPRGTQSRRCESEAKRGG